VVRHGKRSHLAGGALEHGDRLLATYSGRRRIEPSSGALAGLAA